MRTTPRLSGSAPGSHLKICALRQWLSDRHRSRSVLRDYAWDYAYPLAESFREHRLRCARLAPANCSLIPQPADVVCHMHFHTPIPVVLFGDPEEGGVRGVDGTQVQVDPEGAHRALCALCKKSAVFHHR